MKKVLNIVIDADSVVGRVLCTLLYLLAYNIVFEHFAYQLFSYLGIEYIPMNIVDTFIWIVLSILPIFCYCHIKTPSAYMNVFLFIFVYLPFVHALFVVWGVSGFTKYAYSVVMCIFFMIYMGVNRIGNIFKNMEFRPLVPFRAVEGVTLLFTLILIVLKAPTMHFVNILTESELMYELRAENAAIAANNSMSALAYLQGWLSGSFYPFLLMCYLHERKWVKALLVVGGYLSLFMMDMQKLTFFMPFALAFLYVFFHVNEKKVSRNLHSVMSLFIVLVSLPICLLQDIPIFFALGTIIILRTVCVTGWLTQLYVHFFQENPYTHYAHINIVNAVTHSYPFNAPLGIMVSNYTQNANATFFLTDGVAAWGLLGIGIIGFFYLLLSQFIDAIAYRYKLSDVLIIITPMVAYMLNTSIFTTLLTSGAFIVLLLLAGTNNPLDCYSNEEVVDKNIDLMTEEQA